MINIDCFLESHPGDTYFETSKVPLGLGVRDLMKRFPLAFSQSVNFCQAMFESGTMSVTFDITFVFILPGRFCNIYF